MKRLARALLRPLLGPLLRRFRARATFVARRATDERFERMEKFAGQLRADVDGLERYVPALVSAIATQNAMSRANVRSEEEIRRLVTSVLQEFHAVRDDLVRAQGGEGLGEILEPKVLRPERLAGNAPIRLHLGGGDVRRDGFINVDMQPFDAVDVVAHPGDLPFDPETVTEIVATSILDRFGPSDLADTILPHWVRLLAPGASLTVVVPDAGALVTEYVQGGVSFEELRGAVFGSGDSDQHLQRTMFDRVSLTTCLTDAGLEDVVVRRDPVAHDHRIEATARKPSPPSD